METSKNKIMTTLKLDKLTEDIYYLNVSFDKNEERDYKLDATMEHLKFYYKLKTEDEYFCVDFPHDLDLKQLKAVDIFQRIHSGVFRLDNSIGFIIKIIRFTE